MEPGAIGLIGGIGGSVIGLMGGAAGRYFSIRNTKTPAERAFMVKVSVAAWLGLCILVILPLALSMSGIIPRWAYWACFALCFVLLGPGIRWANKRQAELRK